jgi:hypothetical protein
MSKKKKAKTPPKDKDVQPNWNVRCMVCGDVPTMPVTGMCGPCTFGEAETHGGNW